MSKKQSAATSRGKPDDVSGTTTFSTRLTERQKQRVTKAAALRSWSPSHLIRVAALEKAAFILNTGAPTSFNFQALAEDVAERLCRTRVFRTVDEYGRREELPLEPPWNEHVFVEPEAFRASDIQALRKAAQFGGAEFLSLVLGACDRIMAHLAPSGAPREELVDPSQM